MLKEFKEFATRGNIFDMAIGIIIGGAFQKIVTSLVNDIVMPSISIVTGKVDFSTLAFTVGDVSIKYGNFITAIIDFLIIAFSIFIAFRSANKINKKLADSAKGNFEKITKKGKERLQKLSKKNRLFKIKEKKQDINQSKITKFALDIIHKYIDSFNTFNIVDKRVMIKSIIKSVEADGKNIYINYIGSSNTTMCPRGDGSRSST